MKLRCISDKKRVHVFDSKVIHRDGTKCNEPKDAAYVKIGGETFAVGTVAWGARPVHRD